MNATLYGELGTILNWMTRQDQEKSMKTKTPAAVAAGVSVSVVAGIGFEPMTFRL
jgi:site-specific DNA recombinase